MVLNIPKQQSIALKATHEQSQPMQNNILAFRGFNPIKNNKISVK